MARQIEFANVVVRTEKHELLDLFDDLFWPAISSGLKRRARGSTFFIDSLRPLTLLVNGKEQPVIAGRFIKSTSLSREQYYDEAARGLVADRQQLPSAPSAIFVLVLETHKLVYAHETAFAPPLRQFESTLHWLIGRAYSEFIQRLWRENSNKRPRPTYAQLRETHPRPSVDVITLSSGASLNEFLDKFQRIQTIELRLVRPNTELDFDPFFDNLRQKSDRLGSSATTLTQRNSKGLQRPEAKNYLAPVAEDANTIIKVRGVDPEGDALSGDNNNFSIKTFLDRIPKYVKVAAKKLIAEYDKMVESGRIKVSSETEQARIKAVQIAQRNGWRTQATDSEDHDGTET